MVYGNIIEGERYQAGRTRTGALTVTIDDYRDDPGYVDEATQTMLDECADEAQEHLKDLARFAIDYMVDVSCSAIAEALGLKLHTVVAMSNGRHNKAKRRGVSKGIELAEVTYTEIMEAYNESMKGHH